MSIQYHQVRCMRCGREDEVCLTRDQPEVEAFCIACGAEGRAGVHWDPERYDADLTWDGDIGPAEAPGGGGAT